MMLSYRPIFAGAGCLLLFLAVQVIGEDADGFRYQTITLPAKAMHTQFADLNGDGRSDLLAVDSHGKRLLIYRQRAGGFTNIPDQIIELPPHTAWIAPAQVEAAVNRAGRTNFDLLVSTAAGLDYYRQIDGVFESEPRPLLQTNQVFTGDETPILLSHFTNAAIPVISATQVWFYQRNDESQWTSSPPTLLEAKHGNWYDTPSGWSMGEAESHTLKVERDFFSRPQPVASDTPENAGIAKLVSTLKKTGVAPESVEADLDGDGRKDLVLWQFTSESFRTDFYVFLRGADGKLPERPTQILHCRGVPIPVNSIWKWSPIADLRGDGRYELVLLEPDFIVTSIGSLVDMALTRGVKMAITVRSFSHGAFARGGETAVSFRTVMSLYGSWEWPFLICGDFNGDGHPDLIVKRSATQWEIYFSTGGGHWFEPQPAMTFDLPAYGYFERRYFNVSDLNGDGRSDIVSQGLDDRHIFILLTQLKNVKGNP
jgi:FG-GAP-like repeat